MFFEISKLLYVFIVSPISWIIILLIVALIFINKRKIRIISLTLSILIFLVMGNGLLYEYVSYNMYEDYNKAELRKEHYKIAIVMGGFSSINKETGQLNYFEERAGRLWEAVRLYGKGKVDKILITGDGATNLDDKGNSTVNQFYKYIEDFGIPTSAFIIEPKARNTQQNAEYSTEILVDMGVNENDCLLITSVSHMKRSLSCFAKYGFNPDWYSVGLYSQCTQFSHRSFYPDWKIMVKWQTLINEVVGEFVYKIVGYI